jgi:hypothetical protein
MMFPSSCDLDVGGFELPPNSAFGASGLVGRMGLVLQHLHLRTTNEETTSFPRCGGSPLAVPSDLAGRVMQLRHGPLEKQPGMSSGLERSL